MKKRKRGIRNYFETRNQRSSHYCFMKAKKKDKKRNVTELGQYKDFIDRSYKKKEKDIGTNHIDKALSGKRVQVYHDDTTNKTTVVHRGSKGLKDWLVNDAGLLVGYRGKRFKHAKEIQKEAEKKYNGSEVVTVGHSLGGKIAQEVGGKTKTITYNAPTLPQDLIKHKKVGKHVTDIRTKNDLVSILRPLEKRRKHEKLVTLKSHSHNPLSSHSTKALSKPHMY